MASKSEVEIIGQNDAMDERYRYMIPQQGVTMTHVPSEIVHNTIWDYLISADGRHFFSLCAEGNYYHYARLYEYMPKTGQMKQRFALEDSIITHDRAIRPSKLHKSFSFLPDGRLIMTTHSTATAPNHPVWMPQAYYSHQWEGFPGSNILIYDPKTDSVEDLGIPVPRCSIYGGVYEETTNAYYFSDYTRGHLYKFELSNRHVKDYGQAVEIASFHYVVGPDNNIYFSTKSGTFLRLNTKTDKIEDLGIQFPVYDDFPGIITHNQFVFHAFGPDGNLYFLAAYGSGILRYNFKLNTLEHMGRFTPDEVWNEKSPNKYRGQAQGIVFDKYGVMWYCGSCRLVSWDIVNGGKPVHHGLIGTPDCAIGDVPDACLYDDTYYVAFIPRVKGTPGIVSIDLKYQREKPGGDRILCNDPFYYVHATDGDRYYKGGSLEAAKKVQEERQAAAKFAEEFKAENPTVFSTPTHYLTKIWKAVPTEESSVKRVWFGKDGNVHAICGDAVKHHVVLNEGRVLSVDSAAEEPPLLGNAEELFADVKLPARPGRQYIAKATAYAELSCGKKLVGTLDGMLAIVSGEDVYTLGMCAPHGPVHQIVSATDGNGGVVAYGVAGDASDIGTVFSYNDKTGLAIHGRLYCNNPANGGLGASCEPYCIDITADGRKLVIGARDRMGCVYEYDLTEGIKAIWLA